MEWFLLATDSLRSNLQSLRKMASKLEHLPGICPSVWWHTGVPNLVGREKKVTGFMLILLKQCLLWRGRIFIQLGNVLDRELQPCQGYRRKAGTCATCLLKSSLVPRNRGPWEKAKISAFTEVTLSIHVQELLS